MLEHPVGGGESTMICKLDAVTPPELGKRSGQLVLGAAAVLDTCSKHTLFMDYFKSRFLGSTKGELFLSEFRNGIFFPSEAVVIEQMRASQWAFIMFHIN